MRPSQSYWFVDITAISMNDLFACMTASELETYASTGTLPDWFSANLPAPANRSQGVEKRR
jgi:hypothetical protein